MADKIISSSTLNMVAGFADGDDRTINLENPNTAINLAEQVANLGTYLKSNQIVAGDKTGANFTNFKSAKILNKTVTKFDLSSN